MGLFFIWILLSVFVGIAGKERRIGGAAAFFCALLLSPLIGLLAVLLSKSLVDEQRERALFYAQREQTAALKDLKEAKTATLSQQLESLLAMRQAGHLSEAEYQAAKARIITGDQTGAASNTA